MKLVRFFLFSTLPLLFFSTSSFAQDILDYSASTPRVISTMNGSSGFVFNKLKSNSKISDSGYDMLIVDSSVALSTSQIKQLQNYLEQGGVIVVDAKAGTATAQKTVKKIVGFSVNSEAIMIAKSTQSGGGYDVTPVSSNIFASKAVMSAGSQVSNTVDAIFGN